MFCATRIISTRFLTYSRPHLYTLPHRAISSTPPRSASETPLPTPSPELYARLQNTTLAKKLQQSPEALQAIRDFILLLEKEGMFRALSDSSNSILNEYFTARTGCSVGKTTFSDATNETGLKEGCERWNGERNSSNAKGWCRSYRQGTLRFAYTCYSVLRRDLTFTHIEHAGGNNGCYEKGLILDLYTR